MAEYERHACRFVALRYQKQPKSKALNKPEDYQLFGTPQYSYRVLVANLSAAINVVVAFYRQAAGAGNPISKANNRCGLGGASMGAMGHELRALPVDYAGLQLELMADADQLGGAGHGRRAAPYHTGDRAVSCFQQTCEQ